MELRIAPKWPNLVTQSLCMFMLSDDKCDILMRKNFTKILAVKSLFVFKNSNVNMEMLPKNVF